MFDVQDEEKEFKFWDLEAQIAQIKHKLLAPFPTLKLVFVTAGEG